MNIFNKPILWIFLLVYTSAFAQDYGHSGLEPREKESTYLEFSPQGGFLSSPTIVKLISNAGAKIYYTTDGSLPNPKDKSQRYTSPIAVENSTVVRAVAVFEGEHSQILSNTYFIGEPDTDLAVVSLAIPPKLLFDSERGLFVKGKNYSDKHWSLPGANFWSKDEFFINSELFIDSKCVFRSGMGFRIFGGMSRLFPQKSMALVARDKYGKKRIKYPLFGKSGLNSYKYLVLRNSGSDFGKTQFRDLMMTSLVEKWDMEKQDGRPAHVYINGNYWGIYNIREKVNRFFIADHRSVHKDSIDLLEHRLSKKKGRVSHYKNMLEFLENASLADQENYNYLQSQMDIDNFLNYQIAQIYFDNRDAGGNIKYWRPQTDDGRWRWILYDTDFGFGLHDKDAYKNNSVDFHTEEDGPNWPNPEWSTFILRKLLENSDFRTQFVNRFADHLNYSFTEDRVKSCINYYEDMLKPEISRHHDRWNLSSEVWRNQVDRLYNFADNRPQNVRWHLMDKFKAGKTRFVKIQGSKGGQVFLNNYVKVDADKDFEGEYFENYPIQLTAIADKGFVFSHWEGMGREVDDLDVSLKLKSDTSQFVAVFKKLGSRFKNMIVINEVSGYDKESGDWVEIYNNSESPINMERWVFSDGDNEFILPKVVLPPNDYLLLCQDESKFMAKFPKVYRAIGDFDFGLDKRKESLSLYSPKGALIDEFSYSIPPIDTAFTLALLLPNLDNSRQENWEVVYNEGSPSAANSYYVTSKLQIKRNFWMQLGALIALLMVGLSLIVLRRKELL